MAAHGGDQLNRLILFFMLTAASLAAAQSSAKNLALVNGEAITEEDVERVAGGRLRQLEQMGPQPQKDYERERLAIRWRALNYLVERKLVRAEAAKQDISEERLLDREVESNMETLSDEVVAAFLDVNQGRMPLTRRLSRREALSQVRAYMTEQMSKSLLDAYVEKLSRRYSVETFLDPLRTEVATAGFPARGTASAPVTIIEFSDFECDHCAALTPTLDSIQKYYGDRVRRVYRQFPLSYLHSHAQKAAEASLCAHDQQRFWEYHDSLFVNQRRMTTADLKRHAASLRLDTAAFNSCLDSGQKAAAVMSEVDEGYKAGVSSTPTIFINGRMFSGNRESAEIKRIVDEELRRPPN